MYRLKYGLQDAVPYVAAILIVAFVIGGLTGLVMWINSTLPPTTYDLRMAACGNHLVGPVRHPNACQHLGVTVTKTWIHGASDSATGTTQGIVFTEEGGQVDSEPLANFAFWQSLDVGAKLRIEVFQGRVTGIIQGNNTYFTDFGNSFMRVDSSGTV